MKRKNLDRDQRVWEEINMSYHFLLDLALILLSTKILGLIAQKFQMPQVVGALLAGLLLCIVLRRNMQHRRLRS